MKAVILAAGKGERLQPLTTNKPKHLLPVGGKPLLEWLLICVAETGIKEVLIITNFMENMIKEYFGDGSSIGLNLSYIHQKNMKGTADAFGLAEKFVENEMFLGVYGDLYITPDTLKEVVYSHKESKATIAGLQRDPYMYGALELEGDKVLSIVEKPLPGKAPSNVTNAGIYVFPASIFDHIKTTKISPRGEFEVTDAINSMILSGVESRLHMLHSDDWLDVGHPWTLLEANSRALFKMEPKIAGKIEDGSRLIGSVHVDATALIRSGSYIEGPVFIGPRSDVGPDCYIRPGTCLVGDNRVGAGCEVKNSILMKGAHAPHLSYVGDSIIGENCNLGAGTITANLRFDKKNIKMTIKGERMDTGLRKLGCVMGDDVQTGINVSLHPGVKIGTGSWIAPGTIVTKDVGDNVLLGPDGAERQKPS